MKYILITKILEQDICMHNIIPFILNVLHIFKYVLVKSTEFLNVYL